MKSSRRYPMRGAVVALLLFSLGYESAHAQDALVTFYSHGSHLTTGVPGVGHDLYFGSVFDGTRKLFSFRDGFFFHNNRYITLRFNPGHHEFGASSGRHPKDEETLGIDLKAGINYFVRVRGMSEGVPGVFTVQYGRLQLVSCAESTVEMVKATPLNDNALWKPLRAQSATLVVAEASPPTCS